MKRIVTQRHVTAERRTQRRHFLFTRIRQRSLVNIVSFLLLFEVICRCLRYFFVTLAGDVLVASLFNTIALYEL